MEILLFIIFLLYFSIIDIADVTDMISCSVTACHHVLRGVAGDIQRLDGHHVRCYRQPTG